jgi:hypothetical protein
MSEERTKYTSEDKSCAHCGGNLTPHYPGIIWCDNCGSNNPSSPPNISITLNPTP